MKIAYFTIALSVILGAPVALTGNEDLPAMEKAVMESPVVLFEISSILDWDSRDGDSTLHGILRGTRF